MADASQSGETVASRNSKDLATAGMITPRRVYPVLARSLALTHPAIWMRAIGAPMFGAGLLAKLWNTGSHNPATDARGMDIPGLPAKREPTLDDMRAAHTSGLDPGTSYVLHQKLRSLPADQHKEVLRKTPAELKTWLEAQWEPPAPTDF